MNTSIISANQTYNEDHFQDRHLGGRGGASCTSSIEMHASGISSSAKHLVLLLSYFPDVAKHHCWTLWRLNESKITIVVTPAAQQQSPPHTMHHAGVHRADGRGPHSSPSLPSRLPLPAPTYDWAFWASKVRACVRVSIRARV